MNKLIKHSRLERDGSTGFFVMAATCLVAALFTFCLAGKNADSSVPAATTSPRDDNFVYSTKLIEDITVGDLVMARDPETGEVTQKRVVDAFRRTSDHLRILEIKSADGEVQRIETTDEHPFWVTGYGFVNAGELQVGDQLDDAGGANGAFIVRSLRDDHPDGIQVCNFEVEDFHTYFVRAGGTRGPPLFVHNATCEAPQVRLNQAQGALGEDAIRARLQNSKTLELVGEQIKIRTPGEGGHRITDFLVRSKRTGKLSIIEVKTGNATRGASQLAKDLEIADPNRLTSFFGRRARRSGFPNETPTGPIRTFEINADGLKAR